MESAVTRYFCCLATVLESVCRQWASIPTNFQFLVLEYSLETRTPTALPNRKSATHRDQNEVVIVAPSPNREVNNNVPLNAILRPSRSEPG
jgi:hypothetical protein